MLPVLKNLLYITLSMAWEKDINGVVYFWQWLLYTRVFGVVESPTTVYMRDDWEKLSDEKSLRACRRVHVAWDKLVEWREKFCMRVVAVFQIVHELWVVSHESFTCFTTSAFTLYTNCIELSTGGHTVFLSFALQMSIPPQLSLPHYISNLNSSRQKTIWNICTIGNNYNTIFVYTINTIQYLEIWNAANACTWAGLNNSTILKPSKLWRHCDLWTLQEKNENFKNSVVWGCKQAAKISIRLEYSNRMLVRELNWKKFYMK